MGDNSLSTATAGQVIPSDHHNELVQAITGNNVPRNASRVAEDLAGQLGTSVYRWLRAYVQTYHIGTSANNLTISEPVAGEIHIYRSVNKEKIIIKDGSFEFYINNIKIIDFNSSTILAPNLFLAYSSMKAKECNNATASGSVGGSLNVISSANVNFTTQIGKIYILHVTAERIVFTAPDSTIRVNVEGTSQPLTELKKIDLNTGTINAFNFAVRYQAPANGTVTLKVYGRNLAITEMETFVKEA